MTKKIIKMYLHSDKESNRETLDELGIEYNHEQWMNFKYAMSEVECEVELDLETLETKLISAKET
jgi:hypothetical protein